MENRTPHVKNESVFLRAARPTKGEFIYHWVGYGLNYYLGSNIVGQPGYSGIAASSVRNP